jgi:hypothetical protein
VDLAKYLMKMYFQTKIQVLQFGTLTEIIYFCKLVADQVFQQQEEVAETYP